MTKIHWSENALEDFDENIKYLEKSFTENEIMKFSLKTFEVLDIISRTPKAFQETKYQNVFSVPIVSKITLYYRVENERIELIRFWNNLKNPNDLRII